MYRIWAYTQPCLCEVLSSNITTVLNDLSFSCFSFRVAALISQEWRLLRLHRSTRSTMHIILPLHLLPPSITLRPLPRSTHHHHLAHQHHPLHLHLPPSHHSHHLLMLHPPTELHPLHGPHLVPPFKKQFHLSQKHFSSHFQQYCTNSVTGVALTFWVTRWTSHFDSDFFKALMHQSARMLKSPVKFKRILSHWALPKKGGILWVKIARERRYWKPPIAPMHITVYSHHVTSCSYWEWIIPHMSGRNLRLKP